MVCVQQSLEFISIETPLVETHEIALTRIKFADGEVSHTPWHTYSVQVLYQTKHYIFKHSP